MIQSGPVQSGPVWSGLVWSGLVCSGPSGLGFKEGTYKDLYHFLYVKNALGYYEQFLLSVA